MSRPQPASTVDDMDAFFAEISTIRDLLERLKGNVEQIVQLQESMMSMEGYGDGDEQPQMDALAEENKTIMESVKQRAKAIEQENVNLPPSHPNLAMRTLQHGQVKQKFLDFLMMYNETESDFRARVITQMERSIRSLNPDLNEEEIKEALYEQMEGGFQSMMMDQSGRYEGASSALAEAQSRQNEMQKIEETIVQLTEMFIEMSTLVEAQEQVITTIEQQVEVTEQYTEEANKVAKKVRRRKWQLLIKKMCDKKCDKQCDVWRPNLGLHRFGSCHKVGWDNFCEKQVGRFWWPSSAPLSRLWCSHPGYSSLG